MDTTTKSGSTSWDAALQPYMHRLSSKDLDRLKQSTTLEEFLDEFIKIKVKVMNREDGDKYQRFWDVMNKVLRPLKRFSTVIDVAVQVNSAIGSSIWAPLKLVVQICHERAELLEHVEKILSVMGENVERVNIYERTFGTNEMVENAARLLYSDYIDFCTRVIRYSDKNAVSRVLTSFDDEFQEVYAAMREHEQRLDVSAMAAFMHDNMTALSSQIEEQQRKKQREILEWVGDPPDYESCLRRLRSRRLDNSCDWFLDLNKFSTWSQSDGRCRGLLWANGAAGCGKTVLASCVIDHLISKAESSVGEKQVVLYAFCGGDVGSSLAILRSLMHQLLLSKESLFCEVMEDLFAKEGKRQLSSFYSLLPIFLNCLAKVESGYIVVDGLDELGDNSLSDLSDAFQMWLQGASTAKVRLLLTSRWDEKIEHALSSLTRMTKRRDESILPLEWGSELTYQISTTNAQVFIRKYVENEVQSSTCLRAAEAAGVGVVQAICEAVDGHWLYARLLLEDAMRQPTLSRLKDRLQALPTGLDRLYSQILRERELGFEGDDLRLAKTIYAWVCLARIPRLMTARDIGILLSLRDGVTAIDEDDIPLDIEGLIRRLCSPLLEIDEAGRVNVAHFSVKEYFQQAAQSRGPRERPRTVGKLLESSVLLAAAAATYISLDDLQQSFYAVTDRGGSAADLNKAVPLLGQVILPLWDWYGSYLLECVATSLRDEMSSRDRAGEHLQSACRLAEFLVSHHSLPWLVSTLNTYGQHDLCVLFTRIALLHSIVEDTQPGTDSIHMSLVYPKEVKRWINEFPILAKRLGWNFRFYDVVAENKVQSEAPMVREKTGKCEELGPHISFAFQFLKAWSFPEYGRLGDCAAERGAVDQKVAHAIAEALARYWDGPSSDSTHFSFFTASRSSPFRRRSFLSSNHGILPSLFPSTRLDRSQRFRQARGLFYSGEWDACWLEFKTFTVVRGLGLEREIRHNGQWSFDEFGFR